MEYLNLLAPTIESLGGFGYWLIFLIAFSESLAFVGTIIPGSILIYLAGFLASRGYFSIINLIWFTTAGAILGDGLSYFLGTKGKHLFKNENKLLKLSHLEKGEEFFRKHGPKSVFIGRFVGPLRPIIPFIAGLSRMDKKTFFLWNISSAILWSVSHLLVGYFFGGAIGVIEAWTTRAGIVVASIAGALALFWLLIKASRPFLDFVKSAYAASAAKVASLAPFRRFYGNNPALLGFLKERFSSERFSGLPLTLFSATFVLVLLLFFGAARSVLSSGVFISSDERISNALFLLRDAKLVIFFTWIALLSKWQVIVAAALALTLFFRLWRKDFYILPLWITVGAGELFNFLSGLAFYREIPESALYLRSGSSFPDGYSVMAAAFYGFLFYIAFRHSRAWGGKTNALFFGSSAILMVGFSVLYLGESFLSGVLGGYLLGLLCMMVGVSLSEFLKSRETFAPPAVSAKLISYVLLAAWVVFYAGFSLLYNPSLKELSKPPETTKVPRAINIFEDGKLPKFSEELFGGRAEPISFILVAKNDDELFSAMSRAGWRLSDPVGVGSLLRLSKSQITGEFYAGAPMTPSFWNSGTNDFGFEKLFSPSDIYSRRHFRVWKTNFEAPEGRVYVGNVRLDESKWLVIRKSSPYADVERELLFSDLSAAGVILKSKKYDFVGIVEPMKDTSSSFFTDGKVYEVVLK